MKRETVSPQGAVGQFFAVWGSCGHGAGVARRGAVGQQRKRSKRAREVRETWEEGSRGLYGLVAKKQGSGP